MKNNRIEIVQQLVNLDGNFENLVTDLAQFPWDYEGVPAHINAEALKNVLSKYLNSELTEQQVSEWADFLELRDDVVCVEDKRETLEVIMHELANPELEGPLTKNRAAALLVLLK